LFSKLIIEKVEHFNAENAQKELKEFLGKFDPRTYKDITEDGLIDMTLQICPAIRKFGTFLTGKHHQLFRETVAQGNVFHKTKAIIAELSAVINEHAHQIIRIGQEHEVIPRITEHTNMSYSWMKNLSYLNTVACSTSNMVSTLSLTGICTQYDPINSTAIDPTVMASLLLYFHNARSTNIFLCHGHKFYGGNIKDTLISKITFRL